MVEFEYKGIKIEATAEIQQHTFRLGSKSHVNRHTTVEVHFWDFVISDNLYELAMVKSTLSYFMQAYWKRSTKQGSKIVLSTSLEHVDNGSLQSLNLIAKQRKNIQSLEVSLSENGQRVSWEYLSGQEVIMLDIAISKAIALLSPEVKYRE